jgi:hypothetical protein
MQKKLLSFIVTLSLFLFIGIGSASATIIDFEAPLVPFDVDPAFTDVRFFAGDGASFNDTLVDDSYTLGTNQYLVNGIDDGAGDAPGTYGTFIGATSVGGFTFGSVTLDFATQSGAIPGAAFQIDAYLGGALVQSVNISGSSSTFTAYTILEMTAGFDTLYIFDTAGTGPTNTGDYFEIDNFDYTEWVDPNGGGPGPGPSPIPEPATMLLFGFGLLCVTASGRKLKS